MGVVRHWVFAIGLILLGFFQSGLLAAAEPSGIDLGQQITVSASPASYNRRVGAYEIALTLTNPAASTKTFYGPLSVVVNGINLPTVRLIAPSGTTAAGLPYRTTSLASAGMVPGSSLTVPLRFNNPTRQTFQANHYSIYGYDALIQGTVTFGTAMEGGTVILNDLASQYPTGMGITDATGHYAILYANAWMANGYRLRATGGKVGGADFAGLMEAGYFNTDNPTTANITPLTSLVKQFSENQAQLRQQDKRAEALRRMQNIGLFLGTNEWFALNPSSVDFAPLSNAIASAGGMSGWTSLMLTDLQDDDLGPSSLQGFPNAHGGIVQASINGAETGPLSVFVGDTLDAKTSLFGTQGSSYQYAVYSGPAGMTVGADGRVSYPVPADTPVAQNIPFALQISNTANGKGRLVYANLYTMARNVVAEKTVAPGSGPQEIVTPDGGTRVQVSTDQLTTGAKVEIVKGVNTDGNPVTSYYFGEGFTGEVRITPPDPNAAVATRSAMGINAFSGPQMAQVQTGGVQYPLLHEWYSAYANFFMGKLRWGLGNRVDGDATFLAEKTDYFIFHHVEIVTPQNYPAVILKSSCGLSDSACYDGKTPVLFIHGFLPSFNGPGGGESTWGQFPMAMLNEDRNNIRVFEFQWVTAARFQDVAKNLAYAIRMIAQKTGKKVHIVAHSFGGVLTRTYLQGLALDQPYHNDVASVMTVGSPHSGIFDEAKTAHNVLFPKGQDSQLSGDALTGEFQIDRCQQLSCYMMGEYVDFEDIELQSLKLDVPDNLNDPLDVPDAMPRADKPGKFIAVLQDFVNHPLPSGLKFQALIGLTVTRGFNSTIDEGDGLISFEGQRISPKLKRSGARVVNSTDYGGIVTEIKLNGMTNWLPDDTGWDISFGHGYRHSTLTIGPLDSVPEVNIYLSIYCPFLPHIPGDIVVGENGMDCSTEDTNEPLKFAKALIKEVGPLDYDDDGDGMVDLCERKYGFNPLLSFDGPLDKDKDGMTNAQECINQFNPTDAEDALQDADIDGFNNSTEVNAGSNPHDATSTPLTFSVFPSTAQVGEPVVFTQSGVSHVVLATYQWDFGDGNAGSSDTTTRSVTHTYTQPGTYTVLMDEKSLIPGQNLGRVSKSITITSVTPPNTTIVFEDDFNDGLDDLTKWDFAPYYNNGRYHGVAHTETNGYLEIRMDQTDVGGFIESQAFPALSKLRLEMRHFMSPNPIYDYFEPRIRLFSDKGPGAYAIEVLFKRSAWSPVNSCSSYDFPMGFSWLENRNLFCLSNQTQSQTTSSALYNRWITTVIDYDQATGKIDVDYEGDGVIDISGTVAEADRVAIKAIGYSAYGWWTGHYGRVDWIKVYSTSSSNLNVGLVAHYSFDDCTAKDGSGNAHNGTIVGSPGCVNGPKGNALNFDGANDYIVIPNASGYPSNAITMAYWINHEGNTIQAFENYISKDLAFQSYLLGDTHQFQSGFYTGTPGVWSGYLSGVNSVTQTGNVHYAFTYDNATHTGKIYINGQLVSTINDPSSDAIVRQSSEPLYLGRNGSENVYHIKGIMDEVRIYNRILTDAEIIQLAH